MADAVSAERNQLDAFLRDSRPEPDMDGRTVILVDDGLATGATMRAAVIAVRQQQPASITVAVPIGSPTACAALAPDVDELVCLSAPGSFRAVGQAYADFSATSDAEVRSALG